MIEPQSTDAAGTPSREVLAVPGVAGIFPVHVGARLRESTARVRAAEVERVEVSVRSGVTRVRARIAVEPGVPAPATGRAVASALLRLAPEPGDTVTVQIAHIV